MPSTSDNALEFCTKFLEGYTPLEWPDLSAVRHPSSDIYRHRGQVASAGRVHESKLASADAIVATVLCRILGAYCSASAVVIGVQREADNAFNLAKVDWQDGQVWADIITAVDKSLQGNAGDPALTMPVIRHALDFTEKQTPCLPLLRFSTGDVVISPDCSLGMSFDSSSGKFSISSYHTYLHPSFASILASQLSALVDYVLENPTSPITPLPLLSSDLISAYECKSDVYESLSDGYSHKVRVRVATDYLGRCARRFPSSVAVRWHPDPSESSEFDSLTFIEFHQGANKFARWLLERGLQREDRIAICMNRNLLFHIAMMGILRAGGCYVPIDPELPSERKAYIARDSNARFVLTDMASFSDIGENTITIDDASVQQFIQEQSAEDIDLAVPDALAYLLYTSGTTGNPKGCLLTHRGLAEATWALSGMAGNVRMEDLSQGRYLSVASIAFDVHLAEIFVALALGMPIFSAPRSILLENLPFYIKELKITHVGIVPSLIEATMGTVQEDEDDEGIFLRYIGSGGEKMSNSILDRWANHPQVKLGNFYGPSEVTIGCCARFMDTTTQRANIGRSFDNVSSYVVDQDMNILLLGGIGELIVEGPLVGRGYHGRPDLTEKVFLEWPEKGKWAYRTGDLVRMMPDHTLEIIGRIDTQIKLRGVRIESEGISAIIRKASSPSLGFNLDATTVLAKHPNLGADQLVSFLSWDTTVSIATRKSAKKPNLISAPKGLLQKVRNIVNKELPNYMRPSYLIPLSWLPLSSNGKADAKVLIGIFESLDIGGLLTSQDTGESGRSLTEMESRLVAVAALHSQVPVSFWHSQTNLFECGLDSTAIILFAADVRETFKRSISAADIMKNPIIAGITLLLGDSSSNTSTLVPKYVESFSSEWLATARRHYPPGTIERVLPPFPLQEGVLYRSAESDTMYVQHVVMQCKNGTSIPVVKAAWRTVIDRHPILRTVFLFDRTLVQIVLYQRELPWVEKEVSTDDSSNFSQWFLSTESSIICRNINQKLSDTPPFRLHIYSSRNTSYLVLSIHHSLFDGISLPILLSDVEQTYLNTAPRLYPSLVDVLNHMAHVNLTLAKEFWVEKFCSFNWPHFKLASSSEARRLSVPFESSLSSLKASAASQQVTLQALLTCAFSRLLATRIYRTNDVVFGVIRSGRLLAVENIDAAICPTISVLPARVNFRDSGNVLQRIQNDISAVVEFEHLPLGTIQNWTRPGESMFEVLFSVSVRENVQSQLWSVIESEPPHPDYFFAFEVVLDPETDSVAVQAAWTEQDIDSDVVLDVMIGFEASVLRVAEDDKFTVVASESTSQSSTDYTELASKSTESPSPDDSDAPVDSTLISELRSTIADFLSIDEKLLTDKTSFISLGLDSIKSVGLARNLRAKNLIVSAAELMKNSTLLQLGAFLSRQPAKPQGDVDAFYSKSLQTIRNSIDVDSLKLNVDDSVELFPTTMLQSGMLSQTIHSGGKLYLHAFPLALSSTVDVTRLREAWTQTVQKISILRTTFHFLDDLGVWVQAVHSWHNLDWSTDILNSAHDFNQRISQFMSTIKLDNVADFGQPPVHMRLFTPESNISDIPRLVVVLHHALYDGLAVAKLLDVVQSIYHGQELEAPHQFTDILKHFIAQEDTGTSFWTHRLEGYHYLPLRGEGLPATNVASHTASRSVGLSSAAIEETCRSASVTVQCLGQAAWALLMGELLKTTDVVFGHVVSGRSLFEAEDVIGPVLNTIPCRVKLKKDLRNGELLQAIHQANVTALPWQQSSLRSIQKALGMTSLWDSLYVFQPFDKSASGLATIWEMDLPGAEEDAKIQYPLNVEVHQLENGFLINAACHSSLMGTQALEECLQRFEELLRNVVDQPNALILEDLPELFNIGDRKPSMPPRHQAFNHRSQVQEDDRIIIELRRLLAPVTSLAPQQISSATVLGALGIDSITAIQIVTKCRKVGLRLTVGDVVASRTVGELADYVRANRDKKVGGTDSLRAAVHVLAEEKTDILAHFGGSASETIEAVTIASSGMKWLIGAWQKSEGSRFQHAFVYGLPDDLVAGRLKAAWFALLDRHAILRSTFRCATGNMEPRIVTFRPNTSELRASWNEEFVEDHAFFQSVSNRMRALVSKPSSILAPFTKSVLMQSDRKQYLLIHLHHFQYDAWSLPLLTQDLSNLYRGVKPSSSCDLSRFLQTFAPNPEQLEQQERFWRSRFPHPFKAILFPSLRSHGHRTVEASQRTIYTSQTAISNASIYEKRARSLHVPLHVVFLACWAYVQSLYTGADSSTFGLWQAGRSGGIDNIERLAIPCMNVLPLHVRDVSTRGILDIADDIREDLRHRSAMVEQSDLCKVDEWVKGGGKPLCNVFVNIVKIAPDLDEERGILEPINVPYYVPEVTDSTATHIDRLKITNLIQDDVMIDIVSVAAGDAILLSLDCAAHIMDIEHARDLAHQWASTVKKTLVLL